jgi:hypothetical protein
LVCLRFCCWSPWKPATCPLAAPPGKTPWPRCEQRLAVSTPR